MGHTVMSSAIAPGARPAPRVVREHEILRVAGSLVGKDPVSLSWVARREVLNWAQRRTGGNLPDEAWALRDFEYLAGGRNSVAVRIESDRSDIWAIRTDDPDRMVAGRIWTTEVAVVVSGDGPARISARLLVGTSEQELEIEPHSPSLVGQIVERCGLWRGMHEISPCPWLVADLDEARGLADMLADPHRELPVFVLSVPEPALVADQPLLDASALARATLGLAHVAVLPADLTWVLTEQFGKQRSVYGGAVRAYRPGFSDDANPYDHRLILADQLRTPEGVAQCGRWLRSMAARDSIFRTRLGDDVLTFGQVRSAGLELRQRHIEDEGGSEGERLGAAQARIEALEKQLADDRTLLDYFAHEHRAAVLRAETAEAQSMAAASRLQDVLDRPVAGTGSAEADPPLPSDWSDLSAWCDLALAGRVVLTPAARRAVRQPEFEDVQVAARGLVWLASVCRDRRLAGGRGSLADESVAEGIRNAHCGSDQFDFDWQGRRHTADWHIKSGGNTRDPRRCLRIYYGWDAASRQIVVADLPGHRRSRAT